MIHASSPYDFDPANDFFSLHACWTAVLAGSELWPILATEESRASVQVAKTGYLGRQLWTREQTKCPAVILIYRRDASVLQVNLVCVTRFHVPEQQQPEEEQKLKAEK